MWWLKASNKIGFVLCDASETIGVDCVPDTDNNNDSTKSNSESELEIDGRSIDKNFNNAIENNK